MRDLLLRFVRDETATSTLEFVITFPLILTLFVAVFESGIILTRQVLMERSLDEAVRTLRLVRTITDPITGAPRPLTAADIAVAICDNTRAIPNCNQVLQVQLTRINTNTYAVPSPDIACVNREDLPIQPANTFQQGTDNELVLIRACAIIDRLLPISGFGLNLARDDTGGLHLTAASILVNEPQ